MNYLDELYDLRFKAMIETAPQSDRYREIVLSQDQLKLVLDLIESFMPHDANNDFNVEVYDDEVFIHDRV